MNQLRHRHRAISIDACLSLPRQSAPVAARNRGLSRSSSPKSPAILLQDRAPIQGQWHLQLFRCSKRGRAADRGNSVMGQVWGTLVQKPPAVPNQVYVFVYFKRWMNMERVYYLINRFFVLYIYVSIYKCINISTLSFNISDDAGVIIG